MKTEFTISYVAERRTETKIVEGRPWPEDPNGWTYQEVAGFGGNVIDERDVTSESERDA
jgi:hypothetical protein